MCHGRVTLYKDVNDVTLYTEEISHHQGCDIVLSPKKKKQRKEKKKKKRKEKEMWHCNEWIYNFKG